MEQRYIAIPHESVSSTKDSVLLYHRGEKNFCKIPSLALRVLGYTKKLRRIEDHIAYMKKKGFPFESFTWVKNAFELLIKNNFLVSTRKLYEGLKQFNTKNSESPVTTLSWVTKDRPLSLLQSIEGFASHCREKGRAPSLLILDDSLQPHNDVMTYIKNLGKKFIIRYMGAKEKITYIDNLCAAGRLSHEKKEIIDFLFFNPFHATNNCGANRNFFLLATAGEKAIGLDDDIFPHFSTYSSDQQKKAFSSSPDPMEFFCYKDRESLYHDIENRDGDLLSLYEKGMGFRIPDFSEKEGYDILQNITPELAYSIAYTKGKITLAMPGLYGDSGMSSPKKILWLKSGQREEILRKKSIYTSYLKSRQVIRIPSRRLIARSQFFMAYASGYDNRHVLPPFFPAGRNAEFIFSSLINKCFPTYFRTFLPFAISHHPPETREYREEELFDYSLRLTDIVSLLLDEYTPPDHITDEKSRLEYTGGRLSGVGGYCSKDVVELITLLKARHLSKLSLYLESLLIQYDYKPGFWTRDMERSLDTIDREITAPIHFPLKESNQDMDENQAIEQLKKMTGLFGRALCLWPEIWQAAYDYNQMQKG